MMSNVLLVRFSLALSLCLSILVQCYGCSYAQAASPYIPQNAINEHAEKYSLDPVPSSKMVPVRVVDNFEGLQKVHQVFEQNFRKGNDLITVRASRKVNAVDGRTVLEEKRVPFTVIHEVTGKVGLNRH